VRRFIPILLLAVLIIPLAPAAAATLKVGGASYWSLSSLTRHYAMHLAVDELSEVHILEGKGLEVRIAPGLGTALIDGYATLLPYPARYYRGKLVVPSALPRKIDAAIARKRELKTRRYTGRLNVVVDAGHGARDPGAVFGKQTEKSVNLDVSKRLRRLLQERGVGVVMTRTRDVFVSLSGRASIANSSRADIFVSIHANANNSYRISGFEVYTPAFRSGSAARRRRHRSQLLAKELLNAVKVGKIITTRKDSLRSANFHVLRETRMPAVLVEMGYLTNYADRKKLASYVFRERMARAIANGIISYAKKKAR